MTETRINDKNVDFNPTIPNYNFEYVPMPLSTEGVDNIILLTTSWDILKKLLIDIVPLVDKSTS